MSSISLIVALAGHVDRLGDGARDEGLGGGHHVEVGGRA